LTLSECSGSTPLAWGLILSHTNIASEGHCAIFNCATFNCAIFSGQSPCVAVPDDSLSLDDVDGPGRWG
jgi:hypothetical protein